MGTIKTTNIEPIADNGTVTLGSSGDTITIPSGVTVAGAMANTPAFQAYASGSQSIPNNTETLVEYDIEDWDTDSAFNNTSSGNGYAFTVPSGEGGKYLFYMSARKGPWTTSRMYIGLFKNGSNNGEFYAENGDGDWESVTPSVALNVSAGDYFQIKVYQESGSTNSLNGGDRKILFGAYKLIGV